MAYSCTDATALCAYVEAAIGGWQAFIVGIDGIDRAGKSTLSRYLAWQLGVSVVETDLFLTQGPNGILYRYGELYSAIEYRLLRRQPVIVEGVCLLALLDAIGLKADTLIYVTRTGNQGSLALKRTLTEYRDTHSPEKSAHVIYSL